MRQRSLIALCSALSVVGGGLPAFAAERPAFISFGDGADAPAGYVEMCVRDPSLCQPLADQLLPSSASAPAPVPASAAIANEIANRLSTDACEAITEGAGKSCATGQLPAYLHTASLSAKDLTSRNRKVMAAERKSRRSLTRTVRAINFTVNRTVRQRTDLQVHGMDEYWQPSGIGPSAVGDCEDIALQKKLLLLESGFPPDRLFLAVVFRRGVGLHTVLVARLDEGDLVLDSATRPVWNWRKTPYSWLRVQSPENPNQWFRVATG